jgi:hypothetical protein
MSLGSHIVNLFSRSRVEREIEAELQSHLALRIEDSIAAGMSPDAARRDAVLQFGNPTVVKERVGMVDMALFLENIASDIQRAVRQLRKSSVCSSAVRAHTSGPIFSRVSCSASSRPIRRLRCLP